MKYIKKYESIYKGWKELIDFNKIYTKDLHYFKVVGKFNLIGEFIWFNGFVIYSKNYYDKTGFEHGEVYKQMIEYQDWRKNFKEASQEEIEKYNMFSNVNKYNL